MTKQSITPEPAPRATTNPATSIPILAMVIGVVSLFPPMWIFGIPAAVLGVIGLIKYRENRGFSITGIITGVLSTLIAIALVFFMVIAMVFAADKADRGHYDSYDRQDRSEQYYW